MSSARHGLAALAGLVLAGQVVAEGTFELRQGVGTTSPIYLEGSLTSTNYDQHRVTFMRVDIEDPVNEVIDLYGQALSGSPDVQVWCPGGIPLPTPDAPYTVPTPDYTADFDAANGELTSFADVADVQAIGTRPRPPRTYALTGSSATCGQAGVYTIRYASAGIDGAGQEFFDVRVHDTDTGTLETGRVWSDKYAFSMNSGTGTVGASLYVVAGEDRGADYLGIVWELGLNDIAPFGFQLYANERGVGPSQHHYKSVGNSASPLPTMDPQYPIYLNPPAKTVTTPGALGTIDSINTVCTPGGGNDVIIRFDVEGELPYTLRVDENSDMNFDLSEVIATGTSVDGTNTVVWDGTLPGGGTISAGNSYPIQLTLTTGEVHFPFYDVEDADPGPVIMPFSVPSSPTTDLYYWDDTDSSVTSTAGGGTTSGPNGSNSTHDWANGLNDYNDQNMIDTWKYADVEYVEDVYAFPASCASDPRVGLAKDAQIIADNGDGTVQLELAFRVENMGNVDLQNLSLTDDVDAALPAPVTWSIDSLTASGGLVPNAGFDGVGDIELLDGTSALALGDVGFVTLVLTVDFNGQTGPYTNVATVTAEDSGGNPTSDDSHDGTDPDPDGDGIPDEGDPTPIPVAESDLEVTKVIDNAMPYVEDTVTWTITVTNNGPVTETGAQVTDVLPASFTVDSVTPSAGSWSAPVWTLPTLLPGQSETLTLTGRFTADGMFSNTAEVTAAVNPDPDSTPGNGTPGEDDQDSAAATAVPLADLALAKTDGGVSVIPGATVTYTLSVTNNGPSDAASVLLDDPTPAGLAFVSADAPCAGGFPCNLGTVADGATVNINVTFQVPPAYVSPDPIVNNATVSTTTDDPDPGNDAASDTTPLAPPEADLAVSKSVDDAMPLVGDDVTFTVTIVNNGPSQATGVVVNDLLPGGYAFVSATPSTGSYNSGTGVWTVGTMNPSVPETLTITATVNDPPADYDNIAGITGDQPDPVPGNDSDSATVTPVDDADLAVTKTVDDATPAVGSNVTFTVTVTNNGPQDATGVSVTDMLPAGYTFVSASASQGSYNSGTGVWAVGALADGAGASLTITATVNASGATLNTATATGDQPDPTPGNDSDSADTMPQAQADIAVTKIVDNATPDVGDNVTFTIMVSNNGPSDATGVSVNDALPSGYSLQSSSASQGSYAAPTWSVGALANGASATLTLTAQVLASGDYDNTATGSATENDPSPGNNTDSAGTTPVAQADIAVSKSVDNPTPDVGSNVTFTVTVTNNGPSDATGVSVNEALPSGYSLQSSSASQGSYTVPTWSVGALANGASATLTLMAQVLASGDYDNTATGSATENDPVPGNNTDSAGTTPVPVADLGVTKTVDNATPDVGTDVTFSIAVTNNGPSSATNVTVSDPLPAGYSFVSSSASQGSYDDGTGVWTIGGLADGAGATLTVTATVQASGATLNTATVSGDEDDPEPGNDSDSADTDPVPSADVSVTKTDGGATVIPGEDVTYTLVVTNNGPSQADNVMLDDPTPAGLTFASADAPCGGGFPCALGNLADGDSVSVDVTFSVPSGYTTPDPISNTATVSADTNDPDGGNDSATDTTPLGDAEADMEITKTVTPEEPEVGDTVTFTIVVTNNGPSDATGVMVSDPLPAGYTFVSATPSQGTWTVPDWNVGTVANGDSATLDITATVTDVDDYLNTATVIADPVDPVPDNDTDDASIRRVVLALEAVCIDDVAYVNYTVTPLGFTPGANPSDIEWITEDGNNTIVETLTGQPLTGQLLWPGMVLDGGGNPTDWPGWVFVGGEWVPDNDGLRPDMRIHVMVNPEDEQVVTYPPAEVGCSANPPVADLVIDKDDGGVTVATGGSVTYTLTVTNNGPSEADNVIVDDATPAGLTFDANTGACTTPFPCNVGTLDVGDSAVIQATFDVPLDYAGDDPIANIATVTSDTQELEEADNTASDTTPVDFDGQDPVIGVAKTLSGSQGNDPFTLAFTFTVENLGNVGLSDVQVVDDLTTTFPAPAVYSVDSLTATPPLAVNPGYDGSLDTDLLDAAASSLAVGESATIELVITLSPNAAAGPYQNQAFASGLGPVGQVTEDASNDGLDSDPDGDGDPTGPDENTPTPIDVRGFQHFPVPVMSPIGLVVLLLMMGCLGAAGVRRYCAAGT